MHTLFFLHSTLLLFVVLSAAPPSCHAGEVVKTSEPSDGLTKDQATQDLKTPEQRDVGADAGKGKEEQVSPSGQNENLSALFGAAQTRMMRANPPPYTSVGETSATSAGLPSDEKKKRELAQRVRELLSRLPIIPLTQTPILEKATLVSIEEPAPSASPTIVATPQASGPEDHAAAALPPPGLEGDSTATAETTAGDDLLPAAAPEAPHTETPVQPFIARLPVRRYPWRSAAMAAALFGAEPQFDGFVESVLTQLSQEDDAPPRASAQGSTDDQSATATDQKPPEPSGTTPESPGMILPPQQTALRPTVPTGTPGVTTGPAMGETPEAPVMPLLQAALRPPPRTAETPGMAFSPQRPDLSQQQILLRPTLADFLAHADEPRGPPGAAPQPLTDSLSEISQAFDWMTAYDYMVDMIDSLRKQIHANAKRSPQQPTSATQDAEEKKKEKEEEEEEDDDDIEADAAASYPPPLQETHSGGPTN